MQTSTFEDGSRFVERVSVVGEPLVTSNDDEHPNERYRDYLERSTGVVYHVCERLSRYCRTAGSTYGTFSEVLPWRSLGGSS